MRFLSSALSSPYLDHAVNPITACVDILFFFITDWLNLCSLLLTSHFLCSNSLCYLLQYCLFQRGFVTDNISECLECVKMPYFTFLRVSWYWAPSVVQNGNETLNIYSIYHFQRRRV